MQIMIDISEEVYKEIQDGKMYHSVYDIPQESVKAIKNGTPLPKGHGRLIDEKQIFLRLQEWNTSDEMDMALYNFALMRILQAQTVLEEDKGVD